MGPATRPNTTTADRPTWPTRRTPSALTDAQWARYLFYRQNPKGLFAERWSHAAGCRRWFNAVRDTVTYEFKAVYKPGEPQPIATTNAPAANHSTAQGGTK